MYVGTYLDSRNNLLYVNERINGQRTITSYPLILEYYVPDNDGYYMGYDDVRLKKISLKSYNEYRNHKISCKEYNIKTYELNFNLINKVLYKQYKGCPSPELHKSYIDIEVDRKGFEYLTVKQLVDEACCPINAISIYNDWMNILFTFMLKPETLSNEEAQTICNKFENTYLFNDEKDLLKAIIAVLEDTDVATGWNFCLRKDTPIWLPNKIVDINNVYNGLQLYDSKIIKKSNITNKEEYKLTTRLGNNIYSSKDHIFPVSVIDNDKYVSKLLLSTVEDKTVEEIIDLQKDNKSIFVKLCRKNNTNNNLTYRDYILENLNWVLDNYDICFENMDIKIDYSKSRIKQKCYSRIKDKISLDDIKSYICNNNELKVFNTGYQGYFYINLDEEISEDFMHILGLLYTDGSIYKNQMCFYNSNKAVIDRVSNVFDLLKRSNRDRINSDKKYHGVYRRRITRNNKLGFLLSFIYNDNKSINKTLLSMLSYKQFMSFMAGSIDGDGCISNNTITFCNFINDNYKLQELLLWNGVLSTISFNTTTLRIKKCEHNKIKQSLNLWVDYKQQKLQELTDGNDNNSSSKASQTNIKIYGNDIYVRLNEIVPTGNIVEMIDICTDTHYFYANGVKTHNCFFDTPYIVRRITNVLGEEETSKLCLFNQKPNLKEKVNKFNDKNITYEIPGKWFVDYMELYIKHEQGRKESYSLNSIAEIELKEQKVQHDESLEDMYRQRYEDFIKYNRQDTMLVYRIDKKKNYINLHNAQAHDICCSLDQTMGTVGWVDQAIINEAHNNNLLVPDRIEGKNSEFDGVVPPGAYCAEPIVKGLVSDIFSFDMNSLYPTTIRTLNLSPETIFGQVELSLTLPYLWNRIRTEKLWKNVSKQIPNWGAAWGGLWSVLEYDEIMKQSDTVLTLKLESGERVDLTAKEIYGLVFNDDNNLCISATGTIYRTDKQGLIASVLGKWYSERKKLKKELFKYETMASGFIVDDADLLNLLKSTKITYKENETKEYDFEKIKELLNVDKFDELIEFMSENHLYLNDNNVIVSEYQEYFEERQAYYDLAQYVKKIQLNSSYGALLNSASTFYDFRMGASTTMSGRKVVQHLTSKANELLCGVYADKGYCAEYNDTDSKISTTNQWVKRNDKEIQMTVEELFNSCVSYHKDEMTGKEYGFTTDLVLSYNDEKDCAEYLPINYVYRHKTSKPKWEIEDEYGNIITVTSDHSCMVERDGKLITVKPQEIIDGDILLTLVDK